MSKVGRTARNSKRASVAPGLAQAIVPKLGLEGASGNAATMKQAMIAAAKDGKPFCEQCMKSAAG